MGKGHKSRLFSGGKQVSSSTSIFQGSLHMPKTPNTPPAELSPGNMTGENMKNLADGIATAERDDGWTLHAVSVSLGCFKIGRITVPPAVMLPYNGLSSSSSGSGDYSCTNPPPHWHYVQSLLAKSHGGSIKKMQEFMKGGWRDVPENERWWETALAGNVEEKRLANLEAFKAIKNDYHVAKSL